MAFSRLTQNSLHPAIGFLCKLSATNHPVAARYQGMECRIVAVKIIHGGREPMLIVQFPDGTQVAGLFFYELEDETGETLQRRKFEKTALAQAPQFVVSK